MLTINVFCHDESKTMISVVVFQNCMRCVEGETCSCSETCVTCAVDGIEEVNIKVEKAIDIKDEIPEAISSSVRTEHEVRLWGLCELVAARAS
jgi:hypothetical protein